MRPNRSSLVATAAAALVVAACGGGDNGGGADPYGGGGGGGQEAGPTAAEDQTTDEEAAEDTGTGEDDPGADDGEEAGGEDPVITISDFSFDVPGTVEPGAEITVRNEDSVGHTVTADDGQSFDVPVGPGEEVTFTVPEEEGDYPFHCTPHPDMTETLSVGG